MIFKILGDQLSISIKFLCKIFVSRAYGWQKSLCGQESPKKLYWKDNNA